VETQAEFYEVVDRYFPKETEADPRCLATSPSGEEEACDSC